jgi:hypothetical protein
MFVDPSIGLLVSDHLNRWLRKHNRPRGIPEYSFRGVRLTYNRAYRICYCLLGILILAIGCAPWYVPNLLKGNTGWELRLYQSIYLLVGTPGLFLIVKVFRESAVVSDNGIVKFNLLGWQSRELKWHEISAVQVKPAENIVLFRGPAKLKVSLSYDGWDDLLEYAAKQLDRTLFAKLNHELVSLARMRR